VFGVPPHGQLVLKMASEAHGPDVHGIVITGAG